MQRVIGPNTVTLNSVGSGIILLQPISPGSWWDIQRITIKGNSRKIPLCEVLLNDVVMDSTFHGNGNIAEYPFVMTLPPGNILVVKWSNGSPGANMLASATVDEYQSKRDKPHGF